MDNVIDLVNQNQNEFTWEANNCMLSKDHPNFDQNECQDIENDQEGICIDENINV